MSSQLLPGQSLGAGDSVVSDNGQYTFILQTDSNIVLYINYNTPNQKSLWSAHTVGKGIEQVTMETDGKLLGFDSAGHKVWSLGVDAPKNSFLQVTDDGRAAIVCEVWSEPTAPKALGATR